MIQTTKRCPRCGVVLKITNFGKYICPNCGIVNKDELENGEDKNGDMKYVG